MSRSYRKHPIAKSPVDNFFKKVSNRKTRLTEDMPNGSSYKKNHQTWSICDYRIRMTLKEYIGGENRQPTDEELEEYKKNFLRK